MLKLYNTLSRKVEEIPKKDHLNLYTCGPTVYNYAHIGNLRAYILADLLYRTLKYDGYNPRWVMNITDIDDKTIKGTIEKFGKDATVENLREFTKFYLDEFLKDLAEVNVLAEEIEFIRVTDVIPQIQEFIVGLIQKGYAYKAEDGSTYFSIEKYQKDFGDYGELVGQKFLEGKKVGARVKVDEYEKDNLSDFALWKAHDEATDAQIFWDHPSLGKGRPGWHIECSVINQVAFKGEPTDIHTGGVDLIFPHHTNEIAQSQALLGKGNFVKYWFHSEHLLVDGGRMGKRFKNFYTIADLKDKGFSGMDLRYLMLGSSYRAQQNFTWESLLGAHQALEKLFSGVILSPSAKGEESHSIDPSPRQLGMSAESGIQDDAKGVTFLQALDNDLNFPEALGQFWKSPTVAKTINDLFGLKKLETDEPIPSQVQELVSLRNQSRNQKDFAKSDELRKQIEALGYEVMDTPEGQKVRKKIGI